jgi:hypothetical protein
LNNVVELHGFGRRLLSNCSTRNSAAAIIFIGRKLDVDRIEQPETFPLVARPLVLKRVSVFLTLIS